MSVSPPLRWCSSWFFPFAFRQTDCLMDLLHLRSYQSRPSFSICPLPPFQWLNHGFHCPVGYMSALLESHFQWRYVHFVWELGVVVVDDLLNRWTNVCLLDLVYRSLSLSFCTSIVVTRGGWRCCCTLHHTAGSQVRPMAKAPSARMQAAIR